MIQDNILSWSQASPDDFFVFHHLPKTAGTALSSGLSNFYQPENYKWFHGPIGPLEEIAGGTKLRAVAGHFYLNLDLAKQIDRPLILVTLFRDPIDRVISNYYYIRNNDKHPAHEVALNNSLKEIYEKGLEGRVHVSNIMTDMVSLTQVPSRRLDSAMEMVSKYTVFGLQDQTHVLEALLRKLLNDESFVIPILMARSFRPKVEEVDLDTIRIIRKYNQQDIALYEHAVEVYNKKLDEEWI